jgi:glucan phosphoethanolaminetransferase (alkaline phosphatase superfamily)
MFIYIGDNKLTRLAFSFVSLFSLLVCVYMFIYTIYFGQQQWSLDNIPRLKGNTEISKHLRLF